VSKERLPEDDVNTLTHVGAIYEMDITVNCLFVGLNNKLNAASLNSSVSRQFASG